MMIQINHRESHDVDIFFQNPEFLQFLNPEFVTRAISELMIKDEFKNLPGSSFEDAKRLLSSV